MKHWPTKKAFACSAKLKDFCIPMRSCSNVSFSNLLLNAFQQMPSVGAIYCVSLRLADDGSA
jgi:hypothetical protein